MTTTPGPLDDRVDIGPASDGEEEIASGAVGDELGVTAALLDTVDPVSFGRTLVEAVVGSVRHPGHAFGATARYASGVLAAAQSSLARAAGAVSKGPVDLPARDRRFTDPGWTSNAWFYFLLEHHLLFERFLQDLVDAGRLDDDKAGKARFAAQVVADALAPSNYLWSNPAALRKALETGGLSTVHGFRNFIADVRENDGFPRKVDRSFFTVGRDLAATPGKVVYRNDLMELIQFSPQTETVFEIPMLFSPAWINKYYIMDLKPGSSFVEWAVQHHHTVFIISYRNPDASMASVTMDDYLTQGLLEAVDVIGEITGAPQVNVVALCLGGTLATMLLAYLTARGDDRVRSATLTNTLVDFGEPGQLGVFADRRTVESLASRISARGYLDGKQMARTFDLLRANDLIWSYVATNWLMGEHPPPFELLAWNDDSTNMPATMHARYLRECYVKNSLARNELEVAGARLVVSDVKQDMYVLSAIDDHIAPWRSCYKTTQLVQGDTRFVLTSSGHIAGIVNPPGPKTRHWTNPRLDPDPDVWLAGAEEHRGTWWEDWATWVSTRAGERVAPRAPGSDRYPPIADAPGTYVFG